jgi:MtrB/PioB family decaheme-associated outer membrane protein
MSNKRTQLTLAGDYRITSDQRVRAAYDYEQINRWCNDPAANNAQSTSNPTGGTAAAYYAQGGASCAQVPKSADNRLGLTYRAKASDAVDLNAGYTYSNRNATINPAFYSPLQANGQGYENFGFRAFFQGSRKEDQVKAGLNWQATEAFGVGITGRYSRDQYYDDPLGVRAGSTNSVNLDGTYAFSENNTISAYGTMQSRKLGQQDGAGRNALVLVATQWSNTLRDADTTIGLNAKQRGLFGGKFSLSEDMSFSSSKSTYSSASVSLSAAQNIVGATGTAPDIKSNIAQLRLVGAYQIDKVSQVNVGYAYQRLRSNDYYYNAYQLGFTPTSVLNTNQTAPNYAVNVLFASYKYSFQ